MNFIGLFDFERNPLTNEYTVIGEIDYALYLYEDNSAGFEKVNYDTTWTTNSLDYDYLGQESFTDAYFSTAYVHHYREVERLNTSDVNVGHGDWVLDNFLINWMTLAVRKLLLLI